MDTETEILAQDTDGSDSQNSVVSDIDVPVENAPPAPKEDGVQKRIDELTAGMRDAQRRADQANETMLALMAKQFAPAQPAADQFEDVDPAVKRLLNASLEPVKAENTRLQRQLAAMIAQNEAQSTVASMGITDPKVIAAAVDYAAGFRANGLNITAKDAALFAIGKAVAEGTYVPGAPAQQAQVRRGAAPITSAPRTASLQTRQSASLPRNINELSPDEQLAAYEKAGVGDQTF